MGDVLIKKRFEGLWVVGLPRVSQQLIQRVWIFRGGIRSDLVLCLGTQDRNLMSELNFRRNVICMHLLPASSHVCTFRTWLFRCFADCWRRGHLRFDAFGGNGRARVPIEFASILSLSFLLRLSRSDRLMFFDFSVHRCRRSIRACFFGLFSFRSAVCP